MATKRLRKVLLLTLIAETLLLSVPAGAATETYLIQFSELIGLPADCGNGSLYNGCSAANQPGFEFTDALPADAVVTAVSLSFNHGVQCASESYVFEAVVNDELVGTFSSSEHCTCAPRSNIKTFDVDPALYRVGDVNRFLIVNPESCQGIASDPSLGGAFAQVTVTFEGDGGDPGGGGGDCDLTPVLEGIHVLGGGVASEHDSTRIHVSEEADRLAALLSEESEEIRSLVQAGLLRHLLEQELAGSGSSMTASACLPEEHGGHLATTLTIVLETIDAYSAAGCQSGVAELHLDRGDDEIAAGNYVRACNWYRKAYQSAGLACP